MYAYDTSRQYPFAGCTVTCRYGDVSCSDAVKESLDCVDILDDFGNKVGMHCNSPCSSVKRACGPGMVGYPILINEDLPLAMFTRNGENFIGYLTTANFLPALEATQIKCDRCGQVAPPDIHNGHAHPPHHSDLHSQCHHQYHHDDYLSPLDTIPAKDIPGEPPVEYRCRACQHRYPHPVPNTVAPDEGVCSDQRKKLFVATQQLFNQSNQPSFRDYGRLGDVRWVSDRTLPLAVKIEKYPYGFVGAHRTPPYGQVTLPGQNFYDALHVTYNTPYRMSTNTYWPDCPDRIISRRQSNFSNEPTNTCVTCLYNPGKFQYSNLDQHGRDRLWTCSVEDSGWVFVPAWDSGDREYSDSVPSYQLINRDERFYIATYPFVEGRSNFLRWNAYEGNFDVTHKDDATIFSFPSAPVDKLYSGCIFQPSALYPRPQAQPVPPKQPITPPSLSVPPTFTKEYQPLTFPAPAFQDNLTREPLSPRPAISDMYQQANSCPCDTPCNSQPVVTQSVENCVPCQAKNDIGMKAFNPWYVLIFFIGLLVLIFTWTLAARKK